MHLIELIVFQRSAQLEGYRSGLVGIARRCCSPPLYRNLRHGACGVDDDHAINLGAKAYVAWDGSLDRATFYMCWACSKIEKNNLLTLHYSFALFIEAIGVNLCMGPSEKVEMSKLGYEIFSTILLTGLFITGEFEIGTTFFAQVPSRHNSSRTRKTQCKEGSWKCVLGAFQGKKPRFSKRPPSNQFIHQSLYALYPKQNMIFCLGLRVDKLGLFW